MMKKSCADLLLAPRDAMIRGEDKQDAYPTCKPEAWANRSLGSRQQKKAQEPVIAYEEFSNNV
jgi:hypothetical protein